MVQLFESHVGVAPAKSHGAHQGRPCRSRTSSRCCFAPAVAADAAAFESVDLGSLDCAWLREVAQIVDGLLEWRDDSSCAHLRREVIVAEDQHTVLAVCAHELLRSTDGRVYETHRYLMVTAVFVTARRSGIARLLVDSVLQELAQAGTQ